MTRDFDFQREADEPIIRMPKRKYRRTPHSIPIWGTFLLLLAVVLGWCGWTAKRYWDKHYGIDAELQRMDDEYRLNILKIEGEGKVKRAEMEAESILGPDWRANLKKQNKRSP